MAHTEHLGREMQRSLHQDDNPHPPQWELAPAIVAAGSAIVLNPTLSFSCAHDGHPFVGRRYR